MVRSEKVYFKPTMDYELGYELNMRLMQIVGLVAYYNVAVVICSIICGFPFFNSFLVGFSTISFFLVIL